MNITRMQKKKKMVALRENQIKTKQTGRFLNESKPKTLCKHKEDILYFEKDSVCFAHPTQTKEMMFSYLFTTNIWGLGN